MFERPKSGERAVLVHIDFGQDSAREDLQEFHELTTSAGAEPVAVVTGSRSVPEPKYLIGGGKAEEVRDALLTHEAEVVLVNHSLSPSQERNLERLLECRVLDRTSLILDIFSQRARSHEGKIQVELAQLRHLATRLIRGWTHLERQKGGIGLRGPGETQLETDRRLLNDRIKLLNKRLEKVRRQRHQGRRARTKAEIHTVSLVGYTNAGKSTLFNRLTDDTVYVANQLFATLDPTLRRLELPDADAVILADTVGFIRHLPHDLVAAFRSTLQETEEADLLLHVVDAANDERRACIEQVQNVLHEIEADTVPMIEVYNKIDLMAGVQPRVERDEEGRVRRIWLSAVSGDGMELLEACVAEFFRGEILRRTLCLPSSEGRLRARIYQFGKVLEESMDQGEEICLKVEMPRRDFEYLQREEGLVAGYIC